MKSRSQVAERELNINGSFAILNVAAGLGGHAIHG
jgi:hypothetical protein